MPERPRFRPSRRPQRTIERAALSELEKIRRPLFSELRRLLEEPDYHKGQEPHRPCQRDINQMRISPIEARAIAHAFRDSPELRAKLPAVLERLRSELKHLKDTGDRQHFDCPLLEGTRCLVHHTAKPIGCTAWHPGREYSKVAWEAFARLNVLNRRVYGADWKLRVIPLWLKRVFRVDPRRGELSRK